MPSDPAPPIAAPKPWRCNHRHILGYTLRRGGVALLYVFDHALPEIPPAGADFHVVGRVRGEIECECSICGAVRTWHYQKPELQTA